MPRTMSIFKVSYHLHFITISTSCATLLPTTVLLFDNTGITISKTTSAKLALQKKVYNKILILKCIDILLANGLNILYPHYHVLNMNVESNKLRLVHCFVRAVKQVRLQNDLTSSFIKLLHLSSNQSFCKIKIGH